MCIRVLCLAFLLLPAAAHSQVTPNPASYTKVGDKMPSIFVQQLSGDTFWLAREYGKVSVVNFWATWCRPCQLEMPQLEKQIWQKYRSSPSFAMIAIAPEQSRQTIARFQEHHADYSFPLAYDRYRTTSRLFADSMIPRTYVVDRQGIIVYQSIGYAPSNIDGLDLAIQSALSRQEFRPDSPSEVPRSAR